jgi:PII-like signaling protein
MTDEVILVRIYCTEGEHKMKETLRYLHDVEKVAGVTAFRGVAGFGRSGKMHTASLVDLSLDMPVVIEFFDRPEKARAVVEHLRNEIDPGHLVYWPARTNLGH